MIISKLLASESRRGLVEVAAGLLVTGALLFGALYLILFAGQVL